MTFSSSLSLLKNACTTVYRVCSERHVPSCGFLFVSILRQDLNILAQTVLEIEVPLFTLPKYWEYIEFYALQRIPLPFFPLFLFLFSCLFFKTSSELGIIMPTF